MGSRSVYDVRILQIYKAKHSQPPSAAHQQTFALVKVIVVVDLHSLHLSQSSPINSLLLYLYPYLSLVEQYKLSLNLTPVSSVLFSLFFFFVY